MKNKLKLARLCLLLLLLVPILRLNNFLSNKSLLLSISRQDEPKRTDLALESARFGREKKNFLLLPNDSGEPVPFEAVCEGSDLGVPLLANLGAMILNKNPGRMFLIGSNALMNTLSLLILLCLCYFSGWTLTFILVALLGPFYFIPGVWPAADGIASYIGLYGLILAALICMHNGLKIVRTASRRGVALALTSIVLIGVVTLFREAIGTIGLLCLFLQLCVTSVMEIRKKEKLNWWILVILTGLLSTHYVAAPIVELRNRLYHVQSDSYLSTHGFSHTLYLGLGIKGNHFGIEMDDQYGRKVLAEKKSSIQFLSKDYYRFIFREYLNLVCRNKIVVAKIYLEKIRICFNMVGFQAGEILLLIVSVFFVAIGLRPRLDTDASDSSPLFFLFALACLLVLLQGVLGLPGFLYIYPSVFGFIFVWIFMAEVSLTNRKWGLCFGFLILTMATTAAHRSYSSTDAIFFQKKIFWSFVKLVVICFLLASMLIDIWRSLSTELAANQNKD